MPDPPSPPLADPPPNPLHTLINRPADERLREYKYRCAQGMVFGLPVIALQLWGHCLGGSADVARWVPLFQLLLAGWVMYVAAAGMLFEGIVVALRRRVTGDGVAAVIAVGLYLASVASTVRLIEAPLMFHWSVIVVIAWCALKWRVMKTRMSKPDITNPNTETRNPNE